MSALVAKLLASHKPSIRIGRVARRDMADQCFLVNKSQMIKKVLVPMNDFSAYGATYEPCL